MQDIPASHVSVWLDGQALCIRIPGSHEVRLPLDRWRDGYNVGWEIFLSLLRERSRSPGTIGTTSSPIQYDLDKMVAAYDGKIKKGKAKERFTKGQRDSARAVLKKLGLT